jgi:hypothetical protein
MSATPLPAPAPVPRDPDDALPKYNLGSAVYGLISVGALLAAESASRESYGETVGAAALAAVLLWLAHAYSEWVYGRARAGEGITRGGLGRMLRRELPVLGGGTPPLLAVLIAWVAGASLDTAITIALWISAAAILVAEVAAGRQAELPAREVALQAVVGSALGLLILGLKLILH